LLIIASTSSVHYRNLSNINDRVH